MGNECKTQLLPNDLYLKNGCLDPHEFHKLYRAYNAGIRKLRPTG